MKLKYYLRGLGTGILFATIILFVAYSYRMSDSQIKERAKELGMVVADNVELENEGATTTADAKGENDSKEESTPKQEESTTPEATTPEPTTPEATTPEPTTPEPTTEKSTEESTTSDSGNQATCVVTVTNRTISSDVAEQLAEAGVIEDAEEFNDYLVDNGYASNIQNGKFTVTKGMSFREIANLITGR